MSTFKQRLKLKKWLVIPTYFEFHEKPAFVQILSCFWWQSIVLCKRELYLVHLSVVNVFLFWKFIHRRTCEQLLSLIKMNRGIFSSFFSFLLFSWQKRSNSSEKNKNKRFLHSSLHFYECLSTRLKLVPRPSIKTEFTVTRHRVCSILAHGFINRILHKIELHLVHLSVVSSSVFLFWKTYRELMKSMECIC